MFVTCLPPTSPRVDKLYWPCFWGPSLPGLLWMLLWTHLWKFQFSHLSSFHSGMRPNLLVTSCKIWKEASGTRWFGRIHFNIKWRCLFFSSAWNKLQVSSSCSVCSLKTNWQPPSWTLYSVIPDRQRTLQIYLLIFPTLMALKGTLHGNCPFI